MPMPKPPPKLPPKPLPKPPQRKATSIDALPAAACDWSALAEATLTAWHQQLHLHAGRQRVARARLCLGSDWAAAARGDTRKSGHQNDRPHGGPHGGPYGGLHSALRTLAERLARDGVLVEVLIVPGLQRPELRLGWVAWHAPPAAALSASLSGHAHPQLLPAHPAFVQDATHPPSRHPTRPRSLHHEPQLLP